MKRVFEKDLYLILGVKPDATQEEMRNAYLSRTRIIHPDRFDRKKQSQDWNKANEMLTELNEAYSILRNTTTRAQYDESRIYRQQQDPTPRSQRATASQSQQVFELGELTPGEATFRNLPKQVQERLLKRQDNKGEEQFQIKLWSVAWNYIYIVALLCWICYLFIKADGAKWDNDTLFWYAGITMAVGGLIGRNCVSICRWKNAKLKPYFYITPIYFIKTIYDIVYFWPIWTLKDTSVTHYHKNAFYQNSNIILKFDEHSESLTIFSKKQIDAFLTSIHVYNDRLRSAHANRDHEYFLRNDDFHRVPRTGKPTTSLLTQQAQAFIYITTVAICGIGMFAATVANKELSLHRSINYPIASTYTPTPPIPNATSYPYPVQTLPYSGEIRTWTNAERVAPFEIKATEGSHYLLKLVDAHTNNPVMTVFVRSGTTVKVEVPLGTYEVRYASGNTWYGYEQRFGPETSHSKADKTFSFEIVGNQINGYTITLYKVAHGNLHTSTISSADF